MIELVRAEKFRIFIAVITVGGSLLGSLLLATCQARDEVRDQLRNLSNKIDTVQNKLDITEDKTRDMLVKFENAKSILDSLQTETGKVSENVKANRSVIDSLQTKANKLSEDIGNSESKLDSLRTETKKMSEKVQQNKSELEILNRWTEGVEAIVGQHEYAIDLSDARINDIESGIKSLDQEADRLEGIIDGLSDKICILPPGTIIASMLDPEEFAEGAADCAGLWVLADGRKISHKCLYSKITGNRNVPDLRGMFLRGASRNSESDFRYKDDEQRLPGTVQEDTFEAHNHHNETFKYLLQRTGRNMAIVSDDQLFDLLPFPKKRKDREWPDVVRAGEIKKVGNPDETRPQNVAVNFYVKID